VTTTAIVIHTHLLELQAERALATIEGIAVNSVYTADLDATTYIGEPDIPAGCRSRKTGAAGRYCSTGGAASSNDQLGRPRYHHERIRLMSASPNVVPTKAEITERERRQIDQANSSGKTPVVFIHGLWLLPSSWDNWVGLFEENGYAGVTPSWPDDPESVEEARANPEVFARKTLKRVADHTATVTQQLDKKPAVMGHSTGGLLTQMIADRGLSAASVAIDPGPFRGVLPLPLSALKSASPVLRNPLNRGRAITLTFEQFKYGWANALDDEEARHLYDTYHVAGPGVALAQMANANVNPFTEAKVDPRNPNRGPLLIIEGEKDHTVPWAIANAAYNRQKHNESVTEITRIPNRGHSLTIDSGWREVAQTALDFVKRFV
jgi:non-heme chloroperoxidase